MVSVPGLFLCFLTWWLQLYFIGECYMFIDLFALQHIADILGLYRTYNAHQSFFHNHTTIMLLDKRKILGLTWLFFKSKIMGNEQVCWLCRIQQPASGKFQTMVLYNSKRMPYQGVTLLPSVSKIYSSFCCQKTLVIIHLFFFNVIDYWWSYITIFLCYNGYIG